MALGTNTLPATLQAVGTAAEELSAKIVMLEKALSKLSQSGRKFADSLINGQYGYYARPQKFSFKQEACVDKLLAEVSGQGGTSTSNTTVSVGNLKDLFEMFRKAREGGKKYPKINLVIEGNNVELAIAGEKSKYTGELMITDGEAFGANKWYGRVTEKGEWTKAKDYPELREIHTLLMSLSHDAIATADAYGKKTGNCMFCKKSIGYGESTKSIDTGYGPECAKKWGLPWGVKVG